jgi:hypothetical protein
VRCFRRKILGYTPPVNELQGALQQRLIADRVNATADERAAAIYSLIDTAKLNSLDLQAYLRTVLKRIADHPINQLDQLMPRTRLRGHPLAASGQ